MPLPCRSSLQLCAVTCTRGDLYTCLFPHGMSTVEVPTLLECFKPVLSHQQTLSDQSTSGLEFCSTVAYAGPDYFEAKSQNQG